MLKHFAAITLTVASLLVPSFPVRAEGVEGESVLCRQRGWYTIVALSTKKYNVAVCFDETSKDGYYIGQSKLDNANILLPLVPQYESYTGQTYPYRRDNEGFTYKAVNGPYTYQVFVKPNNICGIDKWASLTVFKNGSKIYYQKMSKFLSMGSSCE